MPTVPNTIKFESFGGTEDDYLTHLYGIMWHDFYTVGVTFMGKPVHLEKYPMFNGREYTFDHITRPKRPDQSVQIVDYYRCKKIPWISSILNAAPTPDLKCWSFQDKYRGKWTTRVIVWDEGNRFFIVLHDAGRLFYLITAFTKGSDRDIRKLNEQYNKSKSKLY